MVNTRTDADLSAAVQNALQPMLPWIREEIREEFRTGSGSSNAGGNPTPVTIQTWLERFNKQKPHSFEKATVPVDAEIWISHMEKIFDVMGCRGVVIGISRPLSRVVTGVTVRITTVMDLTGVVAMTTTAAAITITTLAVTTGILAMDVTKETGVLSNPGVPLRATPIQFALSADVDTKESVAELQ
nr:zinc finger, CCHC-type, retrotransposon Gag domain protein [Tanacetum cinerariifolium]